MFLINPQVSKSLRFFHKHCSTLDFILLIVSNLVKYSSVIMINISKLSIALFGRLDTNARTIYGLDKMAIYCDFVIFSRCCLHFSIVSVHTLKKVKIHKFIIGFGLIVAKGPTQTKCFLKILLCIYRLIGQFFITKWFESERYIQKCTLPCVLILIMTS